MTGQEVFEFYLILCKKHNGLGPVGLERAPPYSKKVWNDLADLLCPEMSDEAKELMK